jgi:hypothetical protein
VKSVLPLADAAERLRGKPGRPRKAGVKSASGQRSLSGPAQFGARLLDVPAAAAYFGVSAWTIRDLEAAGTLKRVRVPVAGGGDLRKILFDLRDLDQLIGSWKEARP